MRIVYNSFDGRWSDSPRALHRLLRHHPGTQHTWLAGDAHRTTFPAGTELAPTDGPDAVAVLEAADLVISNAHLDPPWSKAPGALYLQTWHGTPLKRIAGDEPGVRAGDPVPGSEDVARWDLLLAQSAVSAHLLAGAFRYTGPVAVTGYPRNDVLSSASAPAVRARVRASLGLREGVRAVLYTPTWRDDVRDEHGNRTVELAVDLAEAARRLGPGTVLLLRLHYSLSARLGRLAAPGVLDVSAHPDVSELYLAADAMVTDYSSTMFDFAVTGKPMLFFAYDLEHYRDDVRGFYADLEALAPGPVVRTSDALLDALAEGAADPLGTEAEHAERYAAFRDRYCRADDGGAARRVLDLVLPAGAGDVADLVELADPGAAAVLEGARGEAVAW